MLWRTTIVILLLISRAALADTYRFLTEEFPPYNYSDENGKAAGITVDVLQAMRAQLDLPDAYIEVLPWQAGYQIIQQRNNVMLFLMARNDSREELFQWICPATPAGTHVVISKADKSWQLSDTSRQIAAVKDDVSEQQLRAQGTPEQQIVHVRTLELGLKMLDRDRVHLLAAQETVLADLVEQLNLNHKDFKIVERLSHQNEPCFGLSKDYDPDIVQSYQQALDELHATGVTQAIYQKHGLRDLTNLWAD